MTDYTALVTEMLSAFGCGTFSHHSGAFHGAAITGNVGSFGWPWEFRFYPEVRAAAATRDALLRQGWIVEIPISLGGNYRLSDKAVAFVATLDPEWKLNTAAHAAWRTARKAAETEKAANPGRTYTV